MRPCEMCTFENITLVLGITGEMETRINFSDSEV